MYLLKQPRRCRVQSLYKLSILTATSFFKAQVSHLQEGQVTSMSDTWSQNIDIRLVRMSYRALALHSRILDKMYNKHYMFDDIRINRTVYRSRVRYEWTCWVLLSLYSFGRDNKPFISSKHDFRNCYPLPFCVHFSRAMRHMRWLFEVLMQ